jgi:hypothetical protein
MIIVPVNCAAKHIARFGPPLAILPLRQVYASGLSQIPEFQREETDKVQETHQADQKVLDKLNT